MTFVDSPPQQQQPESTETTNTTPEPAMGQEKQKEPNVQSNSGAEHGNILDLYPLALPQGKAKALPSVRLTPKVKVNEVVTGNASDSGGAVRRSIQGTTGIYGGDGDKPHLGGFTDIDVQGISPATWKWMVTDMGVHTMMDVGCGRGISTSWFVLHGVEALCIEGSHDAREKTVLPNPSVQMVEHDFSRGPWWPEKTYDAIWCVEFLEHVGRNFHKNYLPTFRKTALIFASHSNWGGWHHVEVHKDHWWILKMELYGFKYSPELTKRVRAVASAEKNKYKVPNGKDVNAQHVWLTMMVFINPTVASLPQHAHLIYEPGCFLKRENGEIVHRDCATGRNKDSETPLPDEYKPLTLTETQDKDWFEWIQSRVPQFEPDTKKKRL